MQQNAFSQATLEDMTENVGRNDRSIINTLSTLYRTVALHARSRRNELANDDVLLETLQGIGTSLDTSLGKYPSGLLERCSDNHESVASEALVMTVDYFSQAGPPGPSGFAEQGHHRHEDDFLAAALA